MFLNCERGECVEVDCRSLIDAKSWHKWVQLSDLHASSTPNNRCQIWERGGQNCETAFPYLGISILHEFNHTSYTWFAPFYPLKLKLTETRWRGCRKQCNAMSKLILVNLIRKHKLSSSKNLSHYLELNTWKALSVIVLAPLTSPLRLRAPGKPLTPAPTPSVRGRVIVWGQWTLTHQMSCGSVAPTLSQAHTLAMYRAVKRVIIRHKVKVSL